MGNPSNNIKYKYNRLNTDEWSKRSGVDQWYASVGSFFWCQEYKEQFSLIKTSYLSYLWPHIPTQWSALKYKIPLMLLFQDDVAWFLA